MPTDTTTSVVELWNRALSRIGETTKLQSVDDRTTAAELCRRHYGDCLIATLELSHWSFATKQAVLSFAVDEWDSSTAYAEDAYVRYDGIVYQAVQATTGDNPYDDDGTYWSQSYALGVGWEYAYTLPGDFVSLIAFLSQAGDRYEDWSFDVVQNGFGSGLVLLSDMLINDNFVVVEYTALPGIRSAETGQLEEYVSIYPRQFVDAVAWILASELALGLKKDAALAEKMLQKFDRSISQARSNQYNYTKDILEPETPSISVRSF